MEEFTELEFKYNAEEVKLSNFVFLMNEVGYKTRKDISSWDTYFTIPGNKEDFQRFRESTTPELTRKQKVKSHNSWERVECDLPLDPNRITENIVSFHVGMDGYKKNFKIYKTCFIFWQELVNYVYYITYNEEMKETGRFIEVEFNKDKIVEFGGKEKAKEKLKEKAQSLTKLGLNPQNRLKLNLFEINVR